MKPVICLEMLYPQLNPIEKISRIAEQGFKAVEFWDWRNKDIQALISVCRKEGVQIANFSGHRRGSLIAAETHALFFEDLRGAVSAAGKLGCTTLMLLTNELGEGGKVTGQFKSIPAEEKRRNLLQGLRNSLAQTPEHISLVLEPLNTIVDHPGYYLNDMATAVSLIEEINHPRLKVLCDLYHLGVMGEDLNSIIDHHLEQIGYIHVADFPGRHEPGSGSVDWAALLSRLQNKGYRGEVGFEYSPLKDTDESLRRIRSIFQAVTDLSGF